MNNETKTMEAIDPEGYLCSGDVGQVTEDGYLRITGRIKEMLITAGGENVAPVLIEDVRCRRPAAPHRIVSTAGGCLSRLACGAGATPGSAILLSGWPSLDLTLAIHLFVHAPYGRLTGGVLPYCRL